MSKDLYRAISTKTRSAKGTTTVVASTPNPDRYQDVVASDWKLEAYMENPVVQFGHRYDIPPVGRTEKLTVDESTGNLMATIRWDDSSTNPLGQTVANQFRSGFMSAVSVGFQPTESTPRSKLDSEHPAYGEQGMYFTGNRLLEISAVPVPANGEALALRSMGMGQAKSIINVEETEDTYVVTYAKYPPGEEEEPEEEAFGDEDEEDEEEEEGVGDKDEDEECRADEDEDEDEEDEEMAFTSRVRSAVLHLMGHDPAVRQALTPKRKRKVVRRTRDSLSDMLGIDN